MHLESWILDPESKVRGGAAFPERHFTGGIFSDVLFEMVAPERQEGPAASVQGIEFCKIGMLAPEVAPFYLARGHPGIGFIYFIHRVVWI